MIPVFKINNHDYAPYIKHKSGLTWQRDNTNDENAGRDTACTMHPEVTSHQRTLSVKMGPMPFSLAQQLERDLEDGDEGVVVEYPDIKDGVCKRLFYNTSIQSAIEQFDDDGIVVDQVSFTLISIKEATVS